MAAALSCSLGAAGLCLCLRSYRQQLAFRANRLGAGLRIYKTSSETLSSVQQWRCVIALGSCCVHFECTVIAVRTGPPRIPGMTAVSVIN